MLSPRKTLALSTLISAIAAGSTFAQSPYVITKRISTDSLGLEVNGASYRPSLSLDGRYTAFWSNASNLVPGDVNGYADIFVRDELLGTVELISVGFGGMGADGASTTPTISPDGRYVAFCTDATNLFSVFDTNGVSDIYIFDRQLGLMSRASVDSLGFQANGPSKEPSFSGDGKFVTFTSDASNLVSGDTNGVQDIFRRAVTSNQTLCVSTPDSSMGLSAESNGDSSYSSCSGNGRYIVFESNATNLVVGDSNGYRDIFLRDMKDGITERVSVGNSGVQANLNCFSAAISRDASKVAFQSTANSLVSTDLNSYSDIFLCDRSTSTLTLISTNNDNYPSNGASYVPSLSGNGRFIAYQSQSANLVPGDLNGVTDIFVFDSQLDYTERVSTNIGLAFGDGGSYQASISEDGHIVGFSSMATNLIGDDANGVSDIYQYDRLEGGAELLMTPLIASQDAILSVTDATPSNVVLVGWSLSGNDQIATAWGPIHLNPAFLIIPLSTDGAGAASFAFNVPAVLLGFELSIHGIDIGTDYPTSAYSQEIVL